MDRHVLCLLVLLVQKLEMCKGACKVNQHTCGTGTCIAFDWLCDGWQDCNDKSDEDLGLCKRINEESLAKETAICRRPELRLCVSHRPGPSIKPTDFKLECIIEGWMCDGKSDCAHGQDEVPENCAMTISKGQLNHIYPQMNSTKSPNTTYTSTGTTAPTSATLATLPANTLTKFPNTLTLQAANASSRHGNSNSAALPSTRVTRATKATGASTTVVSAATSKRTLIVATAPQQVHSSSQSADLTLIIICITVGLFFLLLIGVVAIIAYRRSQVERYNVRKAGEVMVSKVISVQASDIEKKTIPDGGITAVISIPSNSGLPVYPQKENLPRYIHQFHSSV